MSTAPQPSKPRKPLAAWQTKLLGRIWEDAKPQVTAALEGAKSKLLAALAGQPLLVIGGVVAAIDTLLLKGPRTLPANLQAFLAGPAQDLLDRLLKPPKPLSVKFRTFLAGVVTVAGVLGVWSRVKPVGKP